MTSQTIAYKGSHIHVTTWTGLPDEITVQFADGATQKYCASLNSAKAVVTRWNRTPKGQAYADIAGFLQRIGCDPRDAPERIALIIAALDVISPDTGTNATRAILTANRLRDLYDNLEGK